MSEVVSIAHSEYSHDWRLLLPLLLIVALPIVIQQTIMNLSDDDVPRRDETKRKAEAMKELKETRGKNYWIFC